MINLENVSKTYKNGTHALENVSLHIKPQEFVYITGSTGSGKSTLIRLLDGEEVPSKGTVMVDGTNVGKLKHRKVPVYRRKIGVVFQDYRLLPKKTVFENVAYAMEVVDAPTKEIRSRVREVLKLVDLSHKSAQYPNQLSGGQQQRVAIARAIVNKPKILICDEPTGNLDPEMSDEIVKLLEKINEEEKTTILVVTHDTVIIKNHPKRNIILKEGFLQGDMFIKSATVVDDDASVEEASKTAALELKRISDELDDKPAVVEEVKKEELPSQIVEEEPVLKDEETVKDIENKLEETKEETEADESDDVLEEMADVIKELQQDDEVEETDETITIDAKEFKKAFLDEIRNNGGNK